MTDTLYKNPEPCTGSNTPETDAICKEYCESYGGTIPITFARKLERERDEAIRSCHIWQTGHSKLVADRDDWKQLAVEQEIELKDAWIEIERWRDLCNGWRQEALNAIKDPRE